MKKKILALFLALSMGLSLSACGGSGHVSQPDINLADFCAAIQENYEWPALMSLTDDDSLQGMLDSCYPGLSDISMKQCEVYMAAMSGGSGRFGRRQDRGGYLPGPDCLSGRRRDQSRRRLVSCLYRGLGERFLHCQQWELCDVGCGRPFR